MELSQRTKRILVLAANPKGTSQLRLDQEIREITVSLERAKKRDQFQFQQRWAVRPKDIRRALLEVEPQFVHFCGHGSETGALFLENDVGQPQLVGKEALAGLFELCSDYVECVVLNACYSEQQAEVIAEHINYVVGMDKAIGDKAAIEFSSGFYDALGAGRNIEDAYKTGCNSIALEGISEYLTPKLKTKIKRQHNTLSDNWKNEAYVSLHLVQEILEKAGLPCGGTRSHWYPQFKIKASNVDNRGTIKEVGKPVDFLIDDLFRDVRFLIEVKSANNQISDSARFQLRMYLQYSQIRFGLLIDPFRIEIYEWLEGRFTLRISSEIEYPNQVQATSDLLRSFLDSVTDVHNCNSHI